MYGRFSPILGGGAFFFAPEDEEASVSWVFLNGQHAVMEAMEGGGGYSGSGRGHVRLL
jgi:hypothetical protein